MKQKKKAGYWRLNKNATGWGQLFIPGKIYACIVNQTTWPYDWEEVTEEEYLKQENNNLAKLIGTWPGDETIEDILKGLD